MPFKYQKSSFDVAVRDHCH